MNVGTTVPFLILHRTASSVVKRLDLGGQSVFIEKGDVTNEVKRQEGNRMSRASWNTAWRQLVRLALLTAGLAPIVALVLIGLFRLQHDTPEWVYWKAELIFLIALEIAYGATASLSLLGTLVLGFLLLPPTGQREEPACAGPRAHCFASPSCAAWPWPRRSARAGSRGPIAPRPCPSAASESTSALSPSSRFAQPLQQINLRTNFPRPARRPRDRSGRHGGVERTGSSLRALGVDRQDRRLEASGGDPRAADSP